MNSKILDDFNRFEGTGFIKSTDFPLQTLSMEQKASLNKKGNVLFNQGDIETARRIFTTTGYSDGLSRVGDFFAEKGQELEALKLYWLAHNKRKSEPIVKKMATLIAAMIEK